MRTLRTHHDRFGIKRYCFYLMKNFNSETQLSNGLRFFLRYLIVCSLLIVNCRSGLFAQRFVYNQNCQNAYKSFLETRLQKGREILTSELKANPDNILPIVLINYEDFILLSLNENPLLFNSFKKHLSQRLALIEKADKSSPFFLFSKGLLYFQWSIIKIKYGEYWDACWDFRRSYLIFKENLQKFPDFKPNTIYVGLQEAVISTIPNGYKWALKILGLKGNMRLGMKYLKEYIEGNHQLFTEEAFFYYIYLKNYLENDPKGAVQIIDQYHLDIKSNPLYTFMAANLALQQKNAKLAESILLQKKNSSDFMEFPMLDYELGDAKMKNLDYTAVTYFNKFLVHYKGEFYIKDAYYSIALCYYLQGNTTKANQYIQKTISEGKATSDADKQALKKAKSGKFPHVQLLKARLLNDGGNNREALSILQSIQIRQLSEPSEKLEYVYRLGRVYDELQMDEDAIKFYLQTIAEGATSTEYFAARSCLQLGELYEKRKQFILAKKYYQMLLELGDHEYKNSLDQRAKSGLNRLPK